MLTPPFHCALITGASSGLGKALATLIAKKRIPLLLVSRNEVKLMEIAQELAVFVPIEILALDLTKEPDRKRLAEVIQMRAPDLVINNAGVGLYGDFHRFSYTHHQEIIDLNMLTVMDICLAASKTLLVFGRRGTIVNISSVLGIVPAPGMAVYGASKAFINSFSQALDFELKQHGVRCLVSCPGQIATCFRHQASQGRSKGKPSFWIMRPEKVAKSVWKQIVSQKPYRIIDWRYRLMMLVCRFIPSHWILRSIHKESLKREAGE